jgi:hypothetical protein
MKRRLLIALIMSFIYGHASATTCMVLGEKTARINAVEGERSPVFVTSDCAALRLVSGKALASWVGRDGKPRLIPIRKDGIEVAPQAGAEERSVTVVWNELTTKRERQQPAYMRNIGDERPPKLYVPTGGVVLFDSAESNADLFVKNAQGEQVYQKHFNIGESVSIPRDVLLNTQIYKIILKRVESEQQWQWRIVSADEMRTIDQSLTEIDKVVAEPDQAKIMRAMLFEQMKIQVNMNLAIQELR